MRLYLREEKVSRLREKRYYIYLIPFHFTSFMSFRLDVLLYELLNLGS